MKKRISVKLAGNILLFGMALLMILHILVLSKAVPSDIVWGGQAKNLTAGLIALETIALLATLVFAVVIAAKTGYIRAGKFQKAVNIGMWIVFAFLILNTISNLASSARVENLIFAPIALVLTFFALRLAIEK